MRSRALKSAVKQARGNRKEIINNIQEEISARLEESNISAEVIGRGKTSLFHLPKNVKQRTNV